MEVITITNQKGGVGKTTTAHVLACGLVMKGYKVLAIDVDPQTNFSIMAGMDPEGADIDICDLFRKPLQKNIWDSVLNSPSGFSFIPGSMNLARADQEFTQTGREYMLKKILQQFKDIFDYCVIDTPPALGVMTANALTAADTVIIPMAASLFSIQGLALINGTIANIKEYCNPGLKVAGLLLTDFDTRTNIEKQALEALEGMAADMETKVYSNPIRHAAAIKKNEAARGNLLKDFPREKVTADYMAFIEEYLEGSVNHE